MNSPYITSLVIAPGATQVIDFNVIYGQRLSASFVQMTNTSVQNVYCYLNDYTTPFTLRAGETQVFNHDDLDVFSMSFSNSIADAVETSIEIICGIPQ